MAEPKLTNVRDGSADVVLDGITIGRVRRTRTHYNLQRPITIIRWRAYDASRTDAIGEADSRREAVAFLVQRAAALASEEVSGG